MIEDPYRGIEPEKIWGKTLSGNVSGLGMDGYNLWDTVKAILDRFGIAEQLSGKRVIELGNGQCVTFRDFCIESGAAQYTGVDLFQPHPPDLPLESVDTTIQYKKKDALLYLLDQPSNSVEAIAEFAALCPELIDEGQCALANLTATDIMDYTAREIHRVLVPGGYLVSTGTRDKCHFQNAGLVGNTMVFRKPECETSQRDQKKF